MKKLLSAMVALAMTGVMCMPVFAETVTENGGESETTVKGTYVASENTPTVYSVDVSWGSMEFTYTDAYIGDWDPTTHKYINPVEAKWSCDTDANKVTVTNHSNVSITADLSYSQSTDYKTVKGLFSEKQLTIPSAVGTAVSSAPNNSSKLNLSGDLSKGAKDVVVGTVTVSIK